MDKTKQSRPGHVICIGSIEGAAPRPPDGTFEDVTAATAAARDVARTWRDQLTPPAGN